MRTVDDIEQDKALCVGCGTQHELDKLWLEWFRAVAFDIPLDRLKEICEAEKDGRCVVLPCKVGDNLYVITEKIYKVGNSCEDGCFECEFYEEYTPFYCKKAYEDRCPKVVKPITVELFEVNKEGNAVPCFHVCYEGNEPITDYYLIKEAAEQALKGGASV